ncbi:hypothetical protein AN958_01526 [Leucoagaricus sp. SymC.cos]|nr:hypothetical protein AN958_01526 [Leucoagaricus sp. SymC.cos]
MNNHFQEPTTFSNTDTLNEPQGESRSSSPSISPFTGSVVQTTSPNPLHAPHPEHERTLDPRTFPTVIPPEHDHRTLVLCFDGTGDQFDADNSNIVQLVSLLKKNDRNKQMVYYQAGIGTYTSSKLAASSFMTSIQKTLDEMIAWNLDAHVMGGYEFLMQNYIEGDKICIFGFSRGAYTARSLAGMLRKVGLLPSDNIQQVPFAYKMYTRVDHIGWEQSNGFKKAFCTNVTIDFLGVWDTVDAVGLIPKRLPFTTSNNTVRTFRHAVSLDERRSKFKANLWLGRSKGEVKHDTQVNQSLQQPVEPPESPLSPINEKSASKKHCSAEKEHYNDVEEVWFAVSSSLASSVLLVPYFVHSKGCHCDVGGGAVSNKTRHSLARIPLRWMVRECFKAGTGIMFHSEALREIGLDPSTLYPFVTPRPPLLSIDPEKHKIPEVHAQHPEAPPPFLGSEEEEEFHDALSPAYDQLKIKKAWWILEILPLYLSYQRGDNEWVTRVGSNLARPRFIPKQITSGIKVHRSVRLRMEAQYENEKKKGKQYKPKAHFRVEPTWID